MLTEEGTLLSDLRPITPTSFTPPLRRCVSCCCSSWKSLVAIFLLVWPILSFLSIPQIRGDEATSSAAAGKDEGERLSSDLELALEPSQTVKESRCNSPSVVTEDTSSSQYSRLPTARILNKRDPNSKLLYSCWVHTHLLKVTPTMPFDSTGFSYFSRADDILGWDDISRFRLGKENDGM